MNVLKEGMKMGNNTFLKIFLDDLNDAFNKIVAAERKNEEREKKKP